MRNFLTAILLSVGLAACANTPGVPSLNNNAVTQFGTSDVNTAVSIANASGDAQGAKCWGSMLPVAQAVQNGQAIGVATAIELYRVAIMQAQGPCAPIVMPILVKLGPLLGLGNVALGTLGVAPVVAPLVGIP